MGGDAGLTVSNSLFFRNLTIIFSHHTRGPVGIGLYLPSVHHATCVDALVIPVRQHYREGIQSPTTTNCHLVS